MKYIFLPFLLFLPFCTFANECILPDKNPFMGEYDEQISIGLGQGFDTGILLPPPIRPVPFYIMTIQYSQPTTFFRIPARRSINLSQTIGFGHKNGWDWKDFTIPILYLGEDIAMFRYKRLYMGMGAGCGLQAKENERLGSKLLFQFKLTFGYNFNKKWAMELFIQHFSNANTANENNSYAFYGLGMTYNF